MEHSCQWNTKKHSKKAYSDEYIAAVLAGNNKKELIKRVEDLQ